MNATHVIAFIAGISVPAIVGLLEVAVRGYIRKRPRPMAVSNNKKKEATPTVLCDPLIRERGHLSLRLSRRARMEEAK